MIPTATTSSFWNGLRKHRLRYARFAGIRSDKDAREVTRDGTS